jgi:hypothetical protein
LDEGSGERELPLIWENVEDVPVYYANQYICQFSQDEFILTIGQMVPPALLGDQEQRERQLEQLEHVPIKPLARVALTYARLVELINVLEANRWQYEQAQQIRKQEMGGEDNDHN